VAKTASLAFKAADEEILLVGGAPNWLGRSAWLMTVAGREEGAPPPVDLIAERRNGEFVLSLIRGARVSAVHDLSDGGLAVALAEMAMAGGIGASVEADGLEHAFFFGEDQGRYVLTAPPAESAAIVAEAERLNVPMLRIGVTGGETLRLGRAAPVALAALSEAYESWLPDYMSRPQRANP
jgi:phosphoribosylformylglycinamidine synthase